MHRIARRFDAVDDETGCTTVTGMRQSQDERPTMQVAGGTTVIARVIVALRDDQPLWQGWKWLATHDCDNSKCVNPLHIRVGDKASNNREAVERGLRPVTRGEQHGNAKLTKWSVEQIRADQRSLQVIADEFGVSKSTIWSVKNEQTWTHLDDDTEGDAVHH